MLKVNCLNFVHTPCTVNIWAITQWVSNFFSHFYFVFRKTFPRIKKKSSTARNKLIATIINTIFSVLQTSCLLISNIFCLFNRVWERITEEWFTVYKGYCAGEIFQWTRMEYLSWPFRLFFLPPFLFFFQIFKVIFWQRITFGNALQHFFKCIKKRSELFLLSI